MNKNTCIRWFIVGIISFLNPACSHPHHHELTAFNRKQHTSKIYSDKTPTHASGSVRSASI